MYEALLLSTSDVAALRAALKDPRFSTLTGLVPGLAVALQQPQPEFDMGTLHDAYDAISQVRSNTNYPEDWDDLDDVVNLAMKRRRVFDEAQALAASQPVAAPAAPLRHFVLVGERIGSNDGPSFDAHVYTDFAAACAALDAYAERLFPAEDFDEDDGVQLKKYLREAPQRYWIHLENEAGEVRYTLSLQEFTSAPATAAQEVADAA